jgi:NarL family two-component system response regulator LiaR
LRERRFVDDQRYEDPIRVVIADDHAVFRQGTRELLAREADIQVVGEAANGEEAIRVVSERKPDVAILDISMPVLNGIDATRQIKRESPETRILILTAYDYDEYVIAMLDAGAAGYILKTANYADVVSAVRSVYHGEAVLDAMVARKVWGHFTAKPRGGPTGARGPEALSEREHQVLLQAAKGSSNKEIALALDLSWRTIQTHLRSVFSKLGVASRTEAVVKGLQEGWLRLEDLP